MRPLALVLALLLAGAARADDAPRVLDVKTATVRTEDGRELQVAEGYWLPESVARQRADELVRCPAEREEYRRQAEGKPAGISPGQVALWLAGAVAAGYLVGKTL